MLNNHVNQLKRECVYVWQENSQQNSFFKNVAFRFLLPSLDYLAQGKSAHAESSTLCYVDNSFYLSLSILFLSNWNSRIVVIILTNI